MTAPCKGCELRTEDCHDYCKAYRKFKEKCEAIRKERMKQRAETPPPHEWGSKG